MKNQSTHLVLMLMALAVALAVPASADISVQCPGDTNNDGVSDTPGIVCIHLASGDGFVQMANFDGTQRKLQYIFGFSDVTNALTALNPGQRRDPARVTQTIMNAGLMAANFPAPTIAVDEGDKVYLNLSNVGFVKRPDLFDPHTVHWHGFPQTGAIFDGLPESAIAINVGSTATYFYQPLDPGTYMYHCHAEATEHMQMGMLANLYVRPKQNKLPAGTLLGTHVHQNGHRYVYNDADGSTRYDVEIDLQISGFDPDFHDASLTVQPLPFSLLKDKNPLLNGRGYPDTVNTSPLPAPPENGGRISQPRHALISGRVNQRILLRLSNLNVTRPYTVTSLGVPMLVVGKDARILRGPTGKNLFYTTNSIHLGSGETADVILQPTAAGTYYFYATELNYLSNNTEDFGGIMTEIRVN